MATVLGSAAAAIAWRFLTFDGFSNDHYAHLALAQQMLLGDRPVRDFYDPGWPLMYLLSAAAWNLAGAAMWTEWALTTAAFATAAACTALVAYRLSLSFAITLVVTTLEILIYPRSYAYPKILAYSIGAWAILAVAARPSARRVWAMAATIAIAFLFRHDHGIYIGVASVIAIVLANHAHGGEMVRRRLALLGVAVTLCLSPWIAFVALNGGLVAYFAGGLEFASAEASASMLGSWPRLITVAAEGPRNLFAYASRVNADAWLFWLYWSLPVLCGLIVSRRMARGRERWPGELAAVTALIVLAVLVNGGVLRDVLQARVPDAIVPAAMLGAWALGLCWTERWRRRAGQVIVQLAALGALTVSADAVSRIGRVPDRTSNIGLAHGIRGVREHAAGISHLLRGPHRQGVFPPSRYSQALLPFFAYLDRCTSPPDRLIVTGEFPDILVLGGRGFAGDGVVFGAWYSSVAHEDRSIQRIASRSAPLALLVGDYSGFHLLDAYLRDRYELMTEIPVDGDSSIHVLVERNHPAAGIDPDTGWRCFR